MQKTEQRAFAAVWGGSIVELSTIRDDDRQAACAAEDAFSGWRPAFEAGWRIRPVIIRVEDENEGATTHD